MMIFFFEKEKKKKDQIQNFMHIILVTLTFERAYRYVSIFSAFFLPSEIWNIFFYVTIPEIGRWSSDTLNEDADKDTVYLVYSQKKVEWRVFTEKS